MPRLTIAAVRGAISVRANRANLIREATARLLEALVERNAITPDRVVSALFTTTPDLTADFPAHSARRIGWTDVPLLGAVELAVPGAPKRIVRVLLTLRDVPAGAALTPVYLDEAALLRPDLADLPVAARRARGRQRRIAIIGLGQIGGSIGLALDDAGGWQRVGYDRSATVRREALGRGVVDEAASSIALACRDAELAVVAVPVDALPRVIAQVAAALPRGAVLLDTGSARGGGVTAALVRAAARVQAVGGHPLAGNERRGLAGVSAGLFQGASFALLPVRRSVPPIVRALIRDLGAEPIVVDARRHDAALARTSHLPWLLSRALARLGSRASRARLSGPGFASMTRLAASDPRVAGAFARANAANVRVAWRALRRDLDRAVGRL
jgi:monofunctional chorismate mutase